ncbi:HAMP domain-containing protein [Bosea caraganae]|uniref:histidine kinase n=1 Tax=Bosea caraganae TaxID=2763117 RepID=A0A370L9P3_9HYPH|nr:ATP-binding protein [Bosea caraganae]RDJ21924.1 HAMP domain-containing protein [Bosea caraganae]RDJ28044.1 HAMP domain-containing protein [Bosea caraganae]
MEKRSPLNLGGLVRKVLPRSLLGKYIASFVAAVGVPLIGYTVADIWLASTEHRKALIENQRANAENAAFRISQFIGDIEGQLRWMTHLSWEDSDGKQQRIDALRLLRQAPAIVDLALIDEGGRERLFVSRIAMDRISTLADRSGEAAFRDAMSLGVHYGAVYFQRDSEPFMTIALSGPRREAGVVLAEVNLKLARDMISRIRVGREGQAYVIDRSGRLIIHPDAGLVLRNTDLTATIRSIDADPGAALHRIDGLAGQPALLTQAMVPPLDWRVLAELPVAEANQPLWRALERSLAIATLSLLVAVAIAVAFSWRMARPIRLLTTGAARIGAGHLDHRIEIGTTDEIAELGRQFNTMTAELEGSYATLERKVAERTQELTEANRAKSQFLAAASHDLRQPLHALNLMVAQLRAEKSPVERERLAHRIEQAVASINGLFDDLLDISRIDSGVVRAEISAFPIQAVLDRVEAAFATEAQARGLHFRNRPSDLWVRSDPVLLQRIIGNLVGNALRYTRQGGVLVLCRRREGAIRIEVWDTGIGIPQDKYREIFSEFYQLAPVGALGGEGLGLGLAIVTRLCQLLGHTIDIVSRVGRGSRFSVSVPVAMAEAGASSLAKSADAWDDPLPGARILIVDNDADVLQGTAGLLELWGSRTVTAQNRREAVERLGTLPPDLMIADVHLDEGENGVQLVESLRQQFMVAFPALIISGDVSQSTRERVMAQGLPMLEKPVAPFRLRAAAARLLRAATRPPASTSRGE